MGKKAKEHRKKVAKRNALINDQKKKQQKSAMDFLMKLIRQEKEKGLFDGPLQPPVSENNSELTNQNNEESPIVENIPDNFAGPQI